MGCCHLVHGCRGVPHAGPNKLRRLVEESDGPGKYRLFTAGHRCGGFCRIRVGFDAGANARTIRRSSTVVTCSGVGDDRIARRLCASLLAGRSTVARMDGRRCANIVADPQFQFLAEH